MEPPVSCSIAVTRGYRQEVVALPNAAGWNTKLKLEAAHVKTAIEHEGGVGH